MCIDYGFGFQHCDWLDVIRVIQLPYDIIIQFQDYHLVAKQTYVNNVISPLYPYVLVSKCKFD